MRSVTYSMAVSLDGYVVGPDGSFDWMAHVVAKTAEPLRTEPFRRLCGTELLQVEAGGVELGTMSNRFKLVPQVRVRLP